MSDQITLLLADDHPIVREGLRTIIELQPDFEVVGEAANGSEVLQFLSNSEQTIDVLLLDLDMPEMNGLEVIQALQEKNSPTKVIVFHGF